jgi:diaminohydroxyphosphoribosylaminopyrimidine deaminase/5-amino-6-(5-phosphoribosylamino)uracil reductase
MMVLSMRYADDGLSPRLLALAFERALTNARAYKGATAPNPPVGCVLLAEDGEVLAQAAHQRSGLPHAEANAIAICGEAGEIGRIHTALVTLEPCGHTGRTPPCVEALIRTPVQRVWVGALDPHPRAPRQGMVRLEEAGISVNLIAELDDPRAPRLAAEASALIAPFGKHARRGRPWVVVKTALDAQGSMIPPPGAKTFTSATSLDHAHRLRRESDAIVTGSGCVLADSPAFTVRRVPDHAGKRRHLAILDRRGRTPQAYIEAARARGLDPTLYKDIDVMVDALGAEGVLSVLVEAGPTLRQAFLDRDLWDEEVVFQKSAIEGEPDRVETRTRNTALP